MASEVNIEELVEQYKVDSGRIVAFSEGIGVLTLHIARLNSANATRLQMIAEAGARAMEALAASM